QNGVWMLTSFAWQRPPTFATGASASGTTVFTGQGTSYAGTGWVCTSLVGLDVVGTNSLTFEQIIVTNNLTTSTSFSGDVSGQYNSIIVDGIRGHSVPSLAGQQYSVLMENPTGTLSWSRLTQDQILPGFSITSFSPGFSTLLEIGQSIV